MTRTKVRYYEPAGERFVVGDFNPRLVSPSDAY